MIEELYFYASPKLTTENKPTFNLSTVLCLAMFSFLTVFSSVVIGILITTLYLGLSLFAFLVKDVRLRSLALSMLAIVNIAVVSMYIFGIMYLNDIQFVFWSVIFGIVFFVINEFVWFTKIKKRYYSSAIKSTATTATVTASTIFLFVLIFRIFNKIIGLRFVMVIVLVFLSAASVFFAMILFQKLIIYIFTRNKVQVNCNDR